MASCTASTTIDRSFAQAVSYALRKLGKPQLSLKEEQRSSIKAIYEGNDVFVWLPTGYGKSLCYQALPFVMDHKNGLAGTQESSAVLVITPLIALMFDQVQSLKSNGVKSSIIISSGSGISRDVLGTESSLCSDSILFCTPESLIRSKWRNAVENPKVSERIVAIVVDEAHCISKWSKDFRPSYSHLAEIRSLLPPGIPCMACTATATRNVRKEIIESLEMHGCVNISVSPDRPNIFYEAKPRTDFDTDFHDLLVSLRENLIHTPRVIVYCQSLNMCANLFAHFLYNLGSASYYPPGADQVSDNRLFGMFHSNTPQHNKDVILKSLCNTSGVVRVVFATTVLGMGINLQDVNTVIHYGAPRSLEDYFQESGRGGRSGCRAQSIVFWKRSDCPFTKQPLTTHEQELNDVRSFLENLSECRRKWLLDPSCIKPGEDPNKCCDTCAKNM